MHVRCTRIPAAFSWLGACVSPGTIVPRLARPTLSRRWIRPYMRLRFELGSGGCWWCSAACGAGRWARRAAPLCKPSAPSQALTVFCPSHFARFPIDRFFSLESRSLRLQSGCFTNYSEPTRPPDEQSDASRTSIADLVEKAGNGRSLDDTIFSVENHMEQEEGRRALSKHLSFCCLVV